MGATWDGEGVNFALSSQNATAVDVCLVSEDGGETRFRLIAQTTFVFHGYIAGARLGQRYGYRMHGPYDRECGIRFNPRVSVLDPYAKAVDGVERWDRGCFGYGTARDGDDQPALTDQRGRPSAS